jgi:hypothetical protein
MGFQLGGKQIAIEPGWHFGSRCPGDPARLAVYDVLPDQLLEKIANSGDFRGTLVFDKWMANADSRQCIFFRARIKEWMRLSGEHALKVGFVAQMMDNGYVFDGPNWTFTDSPLQGLYFRRDVYRGVRSLSDFQPWLDRVENFPEEVVDDALKQLPSHWLEEDRDAFEAMLERLMKRRKRVPELIRDVATGRSKPFPEWRETS